MGLIQPVRDLDHSKWRLEKWTISKGNFFKCELQLLLGINSMD